MENIKNKDSRIKRFFKNKFEKISEINEKYKTPRVTITPLVKFALFCCNVTSGSSGIFNFTFKR